MDLHLTITDVLLLITYLFHQMRTTRASVFFKMFGCLFLAASAPYMDDALGDVMMSCDMTADPETYEFFSEAVDSSAWPFAGNSELRLVIKKKQHHIRKNQHIDAYFHPNPLNKLIKIAHRAGDEPKLYHVQRIVRAPELGFSCCSHQQQDQSRRKKIE
jgi:hypothetical protein